MYFPERFPDQYDIPDQTADGGYGDVADDSEVDSLNLVIEPGDEYEVDDAPDELPDVGDLYGVAAYLQAGVVDEPQTTRSRIDPEKQAVLWGNVAGLHKPGEVSALATAQFMEAIDTVPVCRMVIIVKDDVPKLDTAMKESGIVEGYALPYAGRFLPKYGVAFVVQEPDPWENANTLVHEAGGHGGNRAVDLLRYDPGRPGVIHDEIISGEVVEEGLAEWQATEFGLLRPQAEQPFTIAPKSRQGSRSYGPPSLKYGNSNNYYTVASRIWDILFEKQPTLWDLLRVPDTGDPAIVRDVRDEFRATVDCIKPGLYDAVIGASQDPSNCFPHLDLLGTVLIAAGIVRSDLNYLADHGNGTQMVQDALRRYEQTTGFRFSRRPV